MTLWTMKEVINRTGVTESALRYYNSKGVLPPTVQETTGRRQWLYDDVAIERLKRLFLLKYLELPIEETREAINDEEKYRRVVMKSLEELRKERDKLNNKIFIAELLAVAFGMDLVEPDNELDEISAAALNEAIRECVWKIADHRE